MSKKENLIDVGSEIKIEVDRSSHKCENLLEAFQDVLEACENSQFSKPIYRCEEWQQYAFDYLNKRLGLTDEELILLAIILENGTDAWVSLADFSKHLACSKIEVMQRKAVFDSLVEKGIVVVKGGSQYGFPDEVLQAYSKNEVFADHAQVFDTDDALYLELHQLHTLAYRREMSPIALHRSVDKLMERNAELPFVKAMDSYRNKVNDMEFRFLMALTLTWLVADDDTSISDVDFIFTNEAADNRLSNDLVSGKSKLITNNIVEQACLDEMISQRYYTLTEEAKSKIRPENTLCKGSNAKNRQLLSADKIAKRILYYNDATKQQVSELASLLKEQKMRSVLSRLKERNLRSGFTCLFHGSPGTGKTETVYQLAKLTGRDIYQVEYSQLRSKWVGDGEKNVKAMFDEYRRLCKTNTPAPILLLNEADALIGKRMENAERASDKGENAIQNIVLQEMESLDGIMIATTNLVDNMDKAFERRFLYKILFEKPDTEARTKIWRSMLPSLNKRDAATLAEKYPRFAGGQIENITRKVTVKEVLKGETTKLKDIVSLCDNEMINAESHSRKAIGFHS